MQAACSAGTFRLPAGRAERRGLWLGGSGGGGAGRGWAGWGLWRGGSAAKRGGYGTGQVAGMGFGEAGLSHGGAIGTVKLDGYCK